jgi:hypothetical protein
MITTVHPATKSVPTTHAVPDYFMFDISPGDASILRVAMRHTDLEHPGKPFMIYSPIVHAYAGALAAKGYGALSNTDQNGVSAFLPSARCDDWIKAEPLTEVELFVLGYFANRPLGDFEKHRDCQTAYPEFQDAAYGLHKRGLGRFHPHAKGGDDPYFSVSDAGRKKATELASRG